VLQWIGLSLSALAVLGLPAVAMLMRGTIKWTRLEAKLDGVISDVKEIKDNKEQAHLLMLGEMKDDRAATDRRLRWLEEGRWREVRGERNAV